MDVPFTADNPMWSDRLQILQDKPHALSDGQVATRENRIHHNLDFSDFDHGLFFLLFCSANKASR